MLRISACAYGTYSARVTGKSKTLNWRIGVTQNDQPVTVKQIPLWAETPAEQSSDVRDPVTPAGSQIVPMNSHVNFLCEISRGTLAKIEIDKSRSDLVLGYDKSKTNEEHIRFVKYPFPGNYGCIPQTLSDPTKRCGVTGFPGDGDAVDFVEIGREPIPSGRIVPCRILGSFCLLDSGESDWKIIGLRSNYKVSNVEGTWFRDRVSQIKKFFLEYKLGKTSIPEGKGCWLNEQETLDLCSVWHKHYLGPGHS